MEATSLPNFIKSIHFDNIHIENFERAVLFEKQYNKDSRKFMLNYTKTLMIRVSYFY